MELASTIISCIPSWISAVLWYKSAILDDSKSEEKDTNDSVVDQHNALPEFDEKNFYKFFCLTFFLLKNFSKLNSLCTNAKRYKKIDKLLNATAAMHLCMAIVISNLGWWAMLVIIAIAICQGVAEARRK